VMALRPAAFARIMMATNPSNPVLANPSVLSAILWFIVSSTLALIVVVLWFLVKSKPAFESAQIVS